MIGWIIICKVCVVPLYIDKQTTQCYTRVEAEKRRETVNDKVEEIINVLYGLFWMGVGANLLLATIVVLLVVED